METATNGKSQKSLGNIVSELAQTHAELWDQEDRARSKNDADVVQAKRNIDRLNQKRNDLVEQVDEIVLNSIKVTHG